MPEYRQNSHAKSLVVWALLCSAIATVLFVHSAKLLDRPAGWLEIAVGAALLVFGPLAFVVYLVRANLVWVAVDEAQGIVVSGRRVIPWGMIERIERRRPRLRKGSGPAEVKAPQVAELAPYGCDGCVVVAGEAAIVILVILAVVFFFWLIFFAFIPAVLIPVLEVFAPLGDRVTIVQKKGPTLVLRDLRDADAFIAAAGKRARVVAS